ncbi:MAG: hypothetical protein L0Z46_09075 [Nitrospiraceae bacterium]|nr:hypothetical protein [Nitrospiraceae bacterium]
MRAVAIILAVVLGLEGTAPLGGIAQSNPEPASTPAASVGNQDPPPMQEAAVIEEPTPFYKKWWFWTLVVVVAVAVVGAIAIATSSGDDCTLAPGLCAPPPQK